MRGWNHPLASVVGASALVVSRVVLGRGHRPGLRECPTSSEIPRLRLLHSTGRRAHGGMNHLPGLVKPMACRACQCRSLHHTRLLGRVRKKERSVEGKKGWWRQWQNRPRDDMTAMTSLGPDAAASPSRNRTASQPSCSAPREAAASPD